ncbi:peroxiredoxin-like family protein [Roseibacillus persicicus]|uniref:peroxiredoxin-like family protein n=1 Tax=Roseibacillus persicicus TaxID=454148 RepID=UPI00280E9DBE|nr:peroxiredoxin-like family protein [Roseibacillus persicicus]MDQ8189961.1 peroxiredoxin-like family protein [Roseibacillus persicicus]
MSKSLRQQTDAQIEKTRQAKPEFMQAVDALMESAREFQEGKKSIGVGVTAPDFELPNANGEPVSLSKLLAEGPVVVTFYRGDWCPYCNLELRALREKMPDFRALGAQLVAISPQVPDQSLSSSEKETLPFAVLSDQDALVAARYGVAWEVPALLLEHMRNDRDLHLERLNNGNGKILPIPATFVVDGNAQVIWQHVDVDYRTRAEPDDIVAALERLRENSKGGVGSSI